MWATGHGARVWGTCERLSCCLQLKLVAAHSVRGLPPAKNPDPETRSWTSQPARHFVCNQRQPLDIVFVIKNTRWYYTDSFHLSLSPLRRFRNIRTPLSEPQSLQYTRCP